MSTYHALDTKLLDSYFRMHRRLAGKQHRGWYRGSTLAAPPGTHQAPVNLLSVCPPFLVELCHREHGKLVLEVSFNLSIINDLGLQTLPPKMPYALGMDVLFQERAKNHLKRLHHQQAKMSAAFMLLATGWALTNSPDSEGEWVAPPPDLAPLGFAPRGSIDPGSDSGGEADTEEASMEHRAARDFKRPRAKDTRWAGRMRGQK